MKTSRKKTDKKYLFKNDGRCDELKTNEKVAMAYYIRTKQILRTNTLTHTYKPDKKKNANGYDLFYR